MKYTWSDALKLASDSTFANQYDWRVPNINELHSLLETCRAAPSINDTVFPATPANEFWTSTPAANGTNYAWWVYFTHSGSYFGERSFNNSVRLVRGGQSFDNLVQTIDAISFVPLTLAVGGTSTASATGGASGNPVTFSTTTPNICTVLGNLVTGVAAGQCVVTAEQAGNDSYSAAIFSKTINVVRAGQTIGAINFSSSALDVGGSTTVNATGGASGIGVIFNTTTPQTCFVSGSTITGLGVGNCIITANQAGNINYLAAVVATQNITVQAALPGAPLNVIAQSGNKQATVTFTAPSSNGGAAIIDYTVTASPNGLTMTGNGSPITVEGLSNGVTYKFTVTARNQRGTGVASNASNAIKPTSAVAGKPGVPTNVRAEPGHTSIVVYFEPPASNGGADITGYRATCNPGSTFGDNPSSPIVVRPLTIGTKYTCTVSATNLEGIGPESDSVMATPFGQAEARLSPLELDFGSWGIDQSSDKKEIILTNTGDIDVTISPPLSTLADFSSTTLCRTTLAGKGSCSIFVRFTPTEAGPRNGALNVTTSASDTPLSVSLRGTGNAAPLQLLALTLKDATLQPEFNATETHYGATLDKSTAVFTAKAKDGYTLRVNGQSIPNGIASDPLPLEFGLNMFTVRVTDKDDSYPNDYTVAVTRRAPMLSGGSYHSVALNTDGTLWAWGSNANGQFGDETKLDSSVPKVVGNSYMAVAAGDVHTVALKTNGDLLAWGRNQYGQLGNGTTDDQITKQRIDTRYVAVAVGQNHTLGIKTDGSLWAWGDNSSGQLGKAIENTHLPSFIGKGYRAIAAGMQHTLALMDNGHLYAWGKNTSGQLGDTTTTDKHNPQFIDSNFKAISAAGDHSMGIKDDGSLWAWGANDRGQLGGDTTDNSLVPKRIGTDYYKAIAAGYKHNLALKTDGSLWAWGANDAGQLGYGTTIDSRIPNQIGTDFSTMVAGQDFTVAIKNDGTVWAVGTNRFGQLGDGTLAQRSTMAPVVNESVDDFLDMIPEIPNNSLDGKIPPFFVQVAKADMVTSTIKFESDDLNKDGSVYVTALLEPDSPLLGTMSQPAGMRTSSLIEAGSTRLVTAVLTRGGWKQTGSAGPNEALYSGPLTTTRKTVEMYNKDNFDQKNHKGIICVSYVVAKSAKGLMRPVVTGADAGLSCPSIQIETTTPTQPIVMIEKGWNLVGNGGNTPMDVPALFGDANKVVSLWKWVKSGNAPNITSGWAFYTPLEADGGASIAASKGYDTLSVIQSGEGFWVRANEAFSVPMTAPAWILSDVFAPGQSNALTSGWNLVATGEADTPSAFKETVGSFKTLWAWNNSTNGWYFYSPALEASGGLAGYLGKNGYLDFGGLTFQPTTGFWVNMP
jgi:alpha-tubulin suppressor-like RCC1 family protein